MVRVSVLALASLFVLSACLTDSDIAVVKAGPVCAAGPKRREMGPRVWVGKAGDNTCTDLASIPAERIEMSVLGVALISSADAEGTLYMTNSSLVTLDYTSDGYYRAPTLEPPSVADSTTPQYGFFSFGTDVGNRFGPVYAYIGMAAYAMVQGEMSFQNNTFMIDDASTEAQVCAVPIEQAGASTACGAARTVTPGTFKFSLFGYGAGSHFTQFLQAFGHVGVRTAINYTQMGAGTVVTFNDNVAVAAIGTAQIQSLSIAGATTTLRYSFPQWFNYGVAPGGYPAKKGSERVKIRHVASANPGELYIDYLFPKTADGMGQENGWFVYDPTISMGPMTTSSAVRPESITKAVALGTSVLFAAIAAQA